MLKYLRPSNFLKCLFCLIAISLVAAAASSQQPARQPYTLLWRISGKDLKQPSYLFGTMHVKDKRVFNFSDSVMLAIQKCNSFALEVHPDTIVRKMFESLQKKDSTRDLHKMLNEKEYNQLAKKFEEKNGYKMRSDMNPLLAESLLKGNKRKIGDRESFIDAQLYGIARTLNKTIYGLENASEQFDKLIGSPDEIKDRLLGLLETGGGEDDSEEMISIYSTGNLDNILAYMKKNTMADSELVARNHVMVNGMIRYMQNDALFTAVGAAHLPGDNGIISLLRQEGYNVVPVAATFTGVAARYHIDYDKMKWATHTDYDMGYSLDFPSEPLKTDIYAGISTWIYADIANENFYGIYAIPKGTAGDPANREKAINDVINRFAKNKKDKIISRENKLINGLPCVDIVVKNASGYQRAVLFVTNNILYYLYTGNQFNNIHAPYANRFFNSFKAFKAAEKPTNEWITFKNDTAAFSIKIPFKPIYMAKEVPNPKGTTPFKINMFLASDTSGLMNYFVRYNDYPLGNYLADKNAVLNSLSSELSSKAKVIGKPKVIGIDGYEGREIKLIFTGNYHSVARVYIRGNRLYMLLEQNMHEGEEAETNDVFFNSFKLEPYLKPTYINFEPKGGNYKVKLVSAPKIKDDSTKDYNSYLKKWTFYSTTSPTSGGSYTLEHNTIGKFYRTKDLDSLYKTFTDLIVKYTDTLIKADTIIINGKKARDLVIQNRTSKDQRRSRILIDGSDVFFMEAYVAKEQLYGDEIGTFYNSIERTGPATKVDPFSSKASMIAEGLLSADTSEYNEALGALSYYKFTTDELPSVYKALQKSHPDDTVMRGSRYKLIGVLKATHDDKTTEQLQTLFNNLQGKDLLRSHTLNAIAAADPKKGYDIYFNLLINNNALRIKNNYGTFQPLYDSLQYVADHYRQIAPLVDSSWYRDDILSLSTHLLDEKNDAYKKLIKDNFKLLTKHAYSDLDDFLASKDTTKSEWQANSSRYLTIMNEVRGEPMTNTFTNYYITHNPKGWYVSNAVIARINNNLPVNAGLANRLLDSIDSRFEIMQAYYAQKQQDRVPLKYRTQSEFGKLCLYKYASSEDYGSPGKIILLGSVISKGSVYYAYKFTMPERDENETYIGIAGPYKPGSAKLNFDKYNAYTNYDVKGTNWIKQAKALIPELKNAYDTK